MAFSFWRRFLLIFARFLVFLGLTLWLGGMAFFGAMTAPILFKFGRQTQLYDLAPRIVGLILQRFSVLTFVCAALLLLGWLLDGRVLRPQKRAKQWWISQGILSGFCAILAIYLGGILLPRTAASQDEILPLVVRAESGQTLAPAEIAQRANFDAGHKQYQRLAMLNFWLLFAVLIVAVTRTAISPSEESRVLE